MRAIVDVIQRLSFLVLLSFIFSASVQAAELFAVADNHNVWTGLGVHWVWYALFLAVMTWAVALGVGLFYHRILTHRVAKPKRGLGYFFVTVALPAGTPIQWVGNHRFHHQVADTPDDPHSPSDHGFWVAHAGWYLNTKKTWICVLYSFAGPLRMLFDAYWRPRTNLEYVDKAKDIAADPYYAWISKPGPYALIVVGHVVVTWAFVYWLWGAMALPFLYTVQFIYFAIGDAVNSILHMKGKRPFKSGDKSTNIGILGFITSGESYHNTHHAFPSAVNIGILPGQFDLNYFWCRVFEKVGLMTDLRMPPKKLILSKLEDESSREFLEINYRW